VGTLAWWQNARGCPTCGTAASKLIPLDDSSPGERYLGPVRLRYHAKWDQPARVADVLVFSPLPPHPLTPRVNVVQQLHEAWRDAYLNKRPGAKKVDLTSVPQVEVLIRVRDLPAEEAANVWTKVRGGDLFLPGVIQRLRLLEQATSPTSSPTSATRAGDLFVVRYGSRPMATSTCPKKHTCNLWAQDGIVGFSSDPFMSKY